MTKAIRIHVHGGPDTLVYEELAIGKPGTGQVRIRQTAIGLNFIDVYHRSGLYPVPQLPCTLGMEGAGVVESVGDEVSEEKAVLARAHGCEHTILYKDEKFAERVREITNGKGQCEDRDQPALPAF